MTQKQIKDFIRREKQRLLDDGIADAWANIVAVERAHERHCLQNAIALRAEGKDVSLNGSWETR